jgi:N-acetylneuraminate synthase
MSREFRIGRRTIGLDHPTYFIADIAANHNGDLERAKDLIAQVAENGGNAVKFQNFLAETIVSDFGFRALGKQVSHQEAWKKSVYEVYQDASLPLDWTETLKETADECGIDFFTAPYDITLIERLSPFVCAWKLGSGDITWHAEIERLASDGKPFLIATGAAEMDEVRAAVAVARRHTAELVLMQCNTNYSGDLENFRYVNLNVLKTYAREFPDVVLGLSDHTPGHATVLGAVALGGRVIEKHFTDDTTREGPDHGFSMDPCLWKEMVDRTRELELALGGEVKRVMENEADTVVLQRRAVRARSAIRAGATVKEPDLIVLRPCPQDGLPPFRISKVIGRRTLRDIAAGDCVRLSDVE